MSSYQTVFGGDTLLPNEVSYSNYANFTTSFSLTWPSEAGSGINAASMIVEFSTAVAALTITVDDARLIGKGQTIVFNNLGSQAVTVLSDIGTTILSVGVGQIWTVYCTDNSTQTGTWTVFQNGAGTSSTNASAIAGYGMKAIGSTLNQNMTVTTFNNNYTTGASDRASVLNWTGGAGTLTLPSASSMGNDFFINIRNSGTGTLTLTPNGADTINGSASLSMATTDSCILCCTGSVWFTVGLGRSVSSSFNVLSIAVAGTGNYTLSSAEQGQVGYKFTGILTGNRSIIVPNSIAQYWVDNSTTGAFTLTIKTAAGTGIVVPNASNRYILYCDGTNVVDADTASITTPVAIVDGGTGSTTAANARIALGGTATGISVFTAASAAAGRTALLAIGSDESISYSVCFG